jgi:hydrogenase/urease accessory protein HupE
LSRTTFDRAQLASSSAFSAPLDSAFILPRLLESRVAATAVVAFALVFAGAAQAHQVGLSRGQYAVEGRTVASRITFARSELDASIAGGDVGRAIADGLHVDSSAGTCPGQVTSVEPVAPDGIEVVMRHTCSAASDVTLRFGFVERLEAGHRHIAEITTGANTTTFVGYRGNDSVRVPAGATRVDSVEPVIGFFRLGVEHILTGWDHLAFVLGVALASWRSNDERDGSTRRRLKSLALAVTAFTVAHSITLTLGVLGVAAASPAWVEPLIALSIAYAGVEGFVMKRATATYRMTFAFGLVHGLGFAGALREISIPPQHVPGALALFNAGVEVGQLAALLPIVLLLVWIANKAFMPRLVRGASLALALMGAAWFGVRANTSIHDARAASMRNASAVQRGATATPAGSAASATHRQTPDPSPADVERLCSALNELPRIRRAQCEDREPGVALTQSCTSRLGRAVESGAVTLGTDEVSACVGELSKRYETCAFVEQRSAPRVAACEHALHGMRAAGETCRSSLECGAGLFCEGAGPLDAGVCHPPRETGTPCGLSIDPLASFVSIAPEAEHRECQGECVQYRCRDVKAPVARR